MMGGTNFQVCFSEVVVEVFDTELCSLGDAGSQS